MAAGETYEEFVEKFVPKKTTDDCMTPTLVYDAIRDWVCETYNVDPSVIVRPFWPGGDYENFAYPEGCVVVDNPPFSILSKICGFYIERGVRFFLFAPSLMAFSGKKNVMRMNHIFTNTSIVYENGATVITAFVTNIGEDLVAQTSPELKRRIEKAMKETRGEERSLPKYTYPDNVVTASFMQKLARYEIDFKIKRSESAFISSMEQQKEKGKTIFGSGLLISERAAAERAAAERAAEEKVEREVWELSERERAIIAALGR